MKLREYERLKREIVQEYERKLSSLETVWAMAGEKDERGRNGSRVGSSSPIPLGGIVLSIMEVIGRLDPAVVSFDDKEILAKVRDNPNLSAITRGSVKGSLRRLCRKGIIKEFEKGKPGRPTRYSRVAGK